MMRPFPQARCRCVTSSLRSRGSRSSALGQTTSPCGGRGECKTQGECCVHGEQRFAGELLFEAGAEPLGGQLEVDDVCHSCGHGGMAKSLRQRQSGLAAPKGSRVQQCPSGRHRMVNQSAGQGMAHTRLAHSRRASPENPLARAVDRPRGTAILDLAAQRENRRGQYTRDGTRHERLPRQFLCVAHASVDHTWRRRRREVFPRCCQCA